MKIDRCFTAQGPAGFPPPPPSSHYRRLAATSGTACLRVRNRPRFATIGAPPATGNGPVGPRCFERGRGRRSRPGRCPATRFEPGKRRGRSNWRGLNERRVVGRCSPLGGRSTRTSPLKTHLLVLPTHFFWGSARGSSNEPFLPEELLTAWTSDRNRSSRLTKVG